MYTFTARRGRRPSVYRLHRTCIYMYTYIYIYVCIYIYMHIYIFIYVYIHSHTHINIHVYVKTYTARRGRRPSVYRLHRTCTSSTRTRLPSTPRCIYTQIHIHTHRYEYTYLRFIYTCRESYYTCMQY